MTIKEAKHDLLQSLTPQYGEGEALAMCRYVFEDYFGAKNELETFHSFLIEDFEKIKKRLVAGEPVQYVVGFAWFYGLRFKVNSSVLIPRPETEELVEWILQSVPQNAPLSILDIGTGSGCIPITLKVKRPDLDISAVDISEGALITASRNAYRMNADIDFKRIDILNKNEWIQLTDFQIIVSNPPYILMKEKVLMHTNVLQYEPHLALFVEDENALIFYETIADFFVFQKEKNPFLKNNKIPKSLFFECNEHNAVEVINMLKMKGFENIELRQDMSGKDRMIRAF